jgi:hypothetical protein
VVSHLSSAAPFFPFSVLVHGKDKNNHANCQKSDNKATSMAFIGYNPLLPCSKAVYSSEYYNTLSSGNCQYIFILCFCLPMFSSCSLSCARTPESQSLQYFPAFPSLFLQAKIYFLIASKNF